MKYNDNHSHENNPDAKVRFRSFRVMMHCGVLQQPNPLSPIPISLLFTEDSQAQLQTCLAKFPIAHFIDPIFVLAEGCFCDSALQGLADTPSAGLIIRRCKLNAFCFPQKKGNFYIRASLFWLISYVYTHDGKRTPAAVPLPAMHPLSTTCLLS